MSEENQVPTRYKKTELGEIPEEWEIVKINDCCDVKTGGTPSTKNKDYWDGNIPWMSSGEINKKFVYSTEKKITQQGLENSNARILPADSVMVALNDQGKTRGSVAVLKILSTCNQSLACIVPDQKITHYLYLFYNLQSRYSEIRNYTGDTGREGLNLRIIKDINVPLPRLPEQHKIATILSKVDEQIEQTEQIIERTEILKKGLMQKLLTKGIGHTKFKKTELGEMPEEWSVFRLSDLLESKYILSHLDGNHGSNYPKPHEFVESGIPYVSANAIIGGVVDFSKAKYVALERAKRFKKGIAENEDVLLAHNATVGPTALLKTDLPYVILSTSLTYYRCDLQKISNFYLKYYMESPLFQNQLAKVMKQTTRNQVPITMQRNLYFCLPSIEEQRKIGNVLFCIEKQIMKNANNLAKLQELKKGLMQDLLTGKVRVTV